MITAITAENRDDIIAITRSVLPCLAILLQHENIENILLNACPAHTQIRSKTDMAANIFNILTQKDFAIYRLHAISAIEAPEDFKKSLAASHGLLTQHRKITNDLLIAIRESKLEFMQQFQGLLSEIEDPIVKKHCDKLIEILIEDHDIDFDNRGPVTYDGAYNHSSPYDANPYGDHNNCSRNRCCYTVYMHTFTTYSVCYHNGGLSEGCRPKCPPGGPGPSPGYGYGDGTYCSGNYGPETYGVPNMPQTFGVRTASNGNAYGNGNGNGNAYGNNRMTTAFAASTARANTPAEDAAPKKIVKDLCNCFGRPSNAA